jgi:hypothetical protein
MTDKGEELTLQMPAEHMGFGMMGMGACRDLMQEVFLRRGVTFRICGNDFRDRIQFLLQR